jgi:phosphate transport system substrate-binding protein
MLLIPGAHRCHTMYARRIPGVLALVLAAFALVQSQSPLPMAADDLLTLTSSSTVAPFALEIGQIKAVYTSRITNWKALGGADGRITVVNKAEGRSTLELLPTMPRSFG